MRTIWKPSFMCAGLLLLLAACQPASASVSLNSAGAYPLTNAGQTASTPAASLTQEAISVDAVESNECLNCHADKERLIATAEAAEPAESESKGVG